MSGLDLSRLGIPHAFGCEAEFLGTQMPYRTARGLGPIAISINGTTEVFTCRECGARSVWVEGRQQEEARADAPASDADAPTSYARAKIAEILAKVPEMRRGHRRVNRKSVAAEVDVDRDTLSDWITRGWLPWPPA